MTFPYQLLALMCAADTVLALDSRTAAASASSAFRGSIRHIANDADTTRIYTLPIINRGSLMVTRVKLGGQAVDMVLDTGSSDVWLQTNFAPGDDTRYEASLSKTFKEDGRVYDVHMGSGPIHGSFVKDTLTVGGIDVKDQLFAQVSDLPPPLQRAALAGKFDGFLGLGIKSFSDVHPPTFIESMMQQNLINEPVLGMYLPPDASNNGVISVGGIDKQFFTGSLAYMPLTSDTYWQGNLDSMKFGGLKFPKSIAAIDSGSSLLAGPTEHVLTLAQAAGAIPDPRLGGRQFIMDCNNVSSLPELEINLAGNRFPLSPSDYVLRAKGECIFPFMPVDIPPPRGPLWIMGDIFMKKYYCVFDYKNKRIGIAPAVR